MKTATAVALGLATVAFAQTNTTGIPTNVSSGCLSFLTTLNVNPAINTCVTALVDATSEFDPTTSSGTPSSSSVDTALDRICTNFTSCDSSTIRSTLSTFYADCQSDLLGSAGDGSNGNRQLIDLYDVLYVLMPLKSAICTKDGNEYCMHKIATEESNNSSHANGSSSQGSGAATDNGGANSSNGGGAPASSSAANSATASVSHATTTSSSASAATASATHARRSEAYPVSSLYRRADNTTDQQTLGTVAPEVGQYNTIGLPYLFITPNLTVTQLCTTCTAEVVGQYIQWETISPYALGIGNSPLLSGQVALWNKIKTCPGSYAQDLLNNATVTVTGEGSGTSGALATVKMGAVQVVGAIFVAVVGGVMLF